MMDSFRPLKVAQAATKIEDEAYKEAVGSEVAALDQVAT